MAVMPADPTVDSLKIPPHSLEAEQATLGGLLLDNSAWDQIADRISDNDFYHDTHRQIFIAIRELAERDSPFDVVTLAEWLENNNRLDNVGGMPYLAMLARDTPSAANIRAYADIVRERSVLRQLIQIGTEIANCAYNPDGRNSRELLDSAEEQVFAIAQHGSRERGFTGINELLTRAVERIDTLFQLDNPVTGLPTGWADFDEKTAGLQRGDLIIVAGRPSMGKCIASGSRIIDPSNGRLRSIDEMVQKRDGRLLTIDENYQLQAAQASQFIDDGYKPVFRVRTALGREICTTLCHPFLRLDGWAPLRDLQCGDHIALPRRLPIFGQRWLPEHQVKLLAYFIADGCLTQNQPQFTNQNARLRDDFCRAVQCFPGIKTSLIDSAGARTPSIRVASDPGFMAQARRYFAQELKRQLRALSLSLHTVARQLGVAVATVHYWTQGAALPAPNTFDALCRLLNTPPEDLLPQGLSAASRNQPNPVNAWLQELGLWGQSAHSKSLPDVVFELQKPQLALLLNRLFACDGSAYIQNQDQYAIAYATVNKDLARDIQHLLLRFGIIAKLRHRQISYRATQRACFELRITSRRDVLAFIDKIGIFGKEQQLQNIQRLIASKQEKTYRDVLPSSIWPRLLAARGQRSWAEIFQAHGLKPPSNLHIGKRGISRQRLALFAELLEDTDLRNLANSDLYWDRIESIEALGLQQVYDLTVPETHNFIAADMLVHNTTLAMNIAENVAIQAREPVAVFSMEMPGEHLAMRLMSSLGQIDQHRIRTGKLEEDDWPRLTSAIQLLSDAKLFIDDSSALTPTEVRARARRLQREHGQLGLVLVDYIQLMQVPRHTENRTQEVAEISRSLKALAKELNVPVLALSQLNRSLEQRADKRPVMSDLRESGSLEQDADVICFIYRDDVYHPESPDKGIAEIIIGKQRNGPTGILKLTFRGQYTRFDSFAPDLYHDDY